MTRPEPPYPVVNRATGEVIESFETATVAHIDAAITASQQTYSS